MKESEKKGNFVSAANNYVRCSVNVHPNPKKALALLFDFVYWNELKKKKRADFRMFRANIRFVKKPQIKWNITGYETEIRKKTFGPKGKPKEWIIENKCIPPQASFVHRTFLFLRSVSVEFGLSVSFSFGCRFNSLSFLSLCCFLFVLYFAALNSLGKFHSFFSVFGPIYLQVLVVKFIKMFSTVSVLLI